MEKSSHLLAEIGQKAIIGRQGKILLCWGKSGNRWDLPGGRLHLQEDTIDALKRELKEELGVDTTIGAVEGVDVWYGAKSGVPRFMVVYNVQMKNENDTILVQESEIEKVEWFDPSDVVGLDIWEGWKKIIAHYVDVRRS